MFWSSTTKELLLIEFQIKGSRKAKKKKSARSYHKFKGKDYVLKADYG